MAEARPGTKSAMIRWEAIEGVQETLKSKLGGGRGAIIAVIGVVVLGLGALLVGRAKTHVMTNKIITRNALLQHSFAGICINCHLIQNVGPTPINRRTMGRLRLTEEQRRLVRMGQRVDMPSPANALRTPALTREDLLPHGFVGVCSNCHRVLDVGPSAAFMAQALQQVRLETDEDEGGPIAAGASAMEYDEGREDLRDFFGAVALIFFGLLSIYVGLRIALRRYPKELRGKFDLKKQLTIHVWTSLAFTAATLLHWYFSDEGNTFLHLALVLVIWLTVAGLLLRYRLVKGKARQNVRLSHSQRLLYPLLIVLLIIGHWLAYD